MMADPIKRRSARAIRIVILGVLLVGSQVGLIHRPGAVAQDIQATPLTDETVESFAPSSALTLTIYSGPVDFGRLRTGETTQIDGAVVVSVSGTAGGSWRLACSAAPTAAHTTDLSVAALEYARAGTSDWTPFQTTSEPCMAPMNGDALVRFSYRIHVPVSATAGALEMVVTYSVSTLE